MGYVWERIKEYGVKNLFYVLRERAQDNFKFLVIEYICLDVLFDVIVFGINLGIIFLYDRICRRLLRLLLEVCLILFYMYNNIYLKQNGNKMNIIILINVYFIN